MTARRGTRTLQDLGADVGVTYATLSRLERGTHRPTYDTAVKLAAWLGWTVEQVMTAATQPASPTDTPSQEP